MATKLIDVKLATKLYTEDKLSLEKIQKIIGCCYETLVKNLRKANVRIRSNGESLQKIDLKTIKYEYETLELSIGQIAIKHNMSESPIYERLKRANVKFRDPQEAYNKVRQKISKEEHEKICKRYLNTNDNCVDIAKDYNVCKGSICKILKQNNIIITNLGPKHPGWKGGTRDIAMMIRTCPRYKLWQKSCMERDNYICKITNVKGKVLHVHHYKTKFSEILKNFLENNTTLDTSNYLDRQILLDKAQDYQPFWDINNGITISQKSHKKIHNNEIDFKLAKIIIKERKTGKTFKEIGYLTGHNRDTISKLFKKISQGQYEKIFTETIKCEYENFQMSTSEIAQKYNMDQPSIYKKLKKIGIKFRDKIEESKKRKQKISQDQYEKIYIRYSQGGESYGDISKDYGVHKTTISLIVNKFKKPSKKKQTIINNLPDEKILELYQDGWSCLKISNHYNRGVNFAAQRLRKMGIDIGKGRKKYTKTKNVETEKLIIINNKNNQKFNKYIQKKHKISELPQDITQWRKKCFERDGFKSVISGQENKLNCHHIIPLSKIFENCLRKYSILPDDFKKQCMKNDPRFFDTSNGITILETEHKLLEKTPTDAHPIWRLQKTFPKHRLNNQSINMSIFDDNGKITVKKFNLITGINDDIKNLIRYQHYIGKIPPHNLILSAYVDNIIVGLAVFGRGGNRYLHKNSWELLRLCIPYWVENQFGSRFVSRCLKYIKQNHSNIKKIISFCDPGVGHSGGIYRACSWTEDGMTEKNYMYYDPNSFLLLHKSACRRIKNIDKTEKQLAFERGFIKIITCPKIRFFKEL